MRGVESCGMVLCSSREEPKEVEPLGVPEGAAVGDRVTVEGNDDGEPDEVLNPKKKIFEACAPDLKVNGDKLATYKGVIWTVNGSPVTSQTLVDVQIK